MRHIYRWKGLLAFLGAFMLLTDTAGANHVTFDFTLSNYSTSAYANSTSTITFGSVEAASMTIELPDGWDVAQETGTSPITPTPQDEENIGSGTATARWEPFCGSSSNLSLTVTWEDNMTGAPAGAVAHYTVTAGGLFSTEAWLIRHGAGNYDISVPNMPDEWVCSSTTNGAMTLTVKGQTTDGDKVSRNPSTTGVKQATVKYTDLTGTLHSANDTVTIT